MSSTRVPRRWLVAAPLVLALLWLLGTVTYVTSGLPLVTAMLLSLASLGASLALVAVFGGIAWWAANGDK